MYATVFLKVDALLQRKSPADMGACLKVMIRCFEGVMMVQARSRYDSHAAVLRFAILSLTECWRAPRTCTHS